MDKQKQGLTVTSAVRPELGKGLGMHVDLLSQYLGTLGAELRNTSKAETVNFKD